MLRALARVRPQPRMVETSTLGDLPGRDGREVPGEPIPDPLGGNDGDLLTDNGAHQGTEEVAVRFKTFPWVPFDDSAETGIAAAQCFRGLPPGIGKPAGFDQHGATPILGP